MINEQLKIIANSEYWAILREELLDRIGNIKDVTVEIEVNGNKLAPAEAFTTKFLAATKLQEFVDDVDRLKVIESKTDSRDNFN